MSAANGVDQLHRDFHDHIQEPLGARLMNPDSSLVANLMRSLEERGTADWRELTVEWFLVYLITEIGVAPNNFTGGVAALPLTWAMQSTLKDLVGARGQLGWDELTVVLENETI